MRRPGLLFASVAGVGCLLWPGGVLSATTPPPPLPAPAAAPAPAVPPPTTTPLLPVTVPAGPATDPATATPTSAAAPPAALPLPTPPRAGSSIGGLERDTESTFTLRRAAPIVAIAIVCLAVAGHLFGRLRSAAPRPIPSTALARRD